MNFMLSNKLVTFTISLAVIVYLLTAPGAYSGDIYKYKDRDGNTRYSNIKTKKTEWGESYEIIKGEKSEARGKSALNIDHQIENLFYDSTSAVSSIVRELKSDRLRLEELLSLNFIQLEQAQFDLNANAINLERCYVNPVYAFLYLFCGGLEFRRQDILNEIDLINNQIESIRHQILNVDLQIAAYENPGSAVSCKVTEIIGGNSFNCSFPNGSRTVKLIGVETPESGENITSGLETLILGKNVLLTFDSQASDSYGRLLAYVYLNPETMLNALLLRQGYGFAVFSPRYRMINEFREFEKLARQNRIGIWKN